MDNILIVVCAVAVLALATAGLMSKIITKPIVKMNESAKRHAKGEYGTDFTVSGYREIDELADTLNYASKELAQTDTLQKELISNVSHDLRTPLTMIKGYGEVMRDIPGENTSENIQIIIDETTRLSDLVKMFASSYFSQTEFLKIVKLQSCGSAFLSLYFFGTIFIKVFLQNCYYVILLFCFPYKFTFN